jgi:aerobic carbon-monoxide dehydrogenase medium subunit
VKFPPFAYHAPSTVSEAIDALSSDPDAKVLAGGQSLLPLLALRLSQPSALIDLRHVDELSFVDAADGVVRIGAGTTLAALEDSVVIAEKLPLLAQAVRFVAHRPIRNRGSIGGSLAHADPAAEMPAVAVALGAILVVGGPSGERRIDARDFFTGPFTTVLADDEILSSIEFPPDEATWTFLEIARRSGDFALAIAAVGLTFDGDACKGATVVLQGVGSKPIRAAEAEAALIGAPIGDAAAQRAADAATADLKPRADIHGSSDYRRRLAQTLVRRATLAAGRGNGK